MKNHLYSVALTKGRVKVLYYMFFPFTDIETARLYIEHIQIGLPTKWKFEITELVGNY